MPDLLTDPAHWQLRAHEARGQAQKLSDPEAKAAKHQMAEKYERLAARATEWMNKVQDVPRVPRSAPPTAPQTVSVIEACVARPRYSKTFGGKREPARASVRLWSPSALAVRILKTAAQGERDRQRLRDAALVDLAA